MNMKNNTDTKTLLTYILYPNNQRAKTLIELPRNLDEDGRAVVIFPAQSQEI